jgi:hypothetical protein
LGFQFSLLYEDSLPPSLSLLVSVFRELLG